MAADVDDVRVRIRVDDSDVKRKTDDTERAMDKLAKKGGGFKAPFLGGLIGGAVGTVVGGAEQTVLSPILELLMNVLAAALLPLVVALLPLVQALTPILMDLSKLIAPLVSKGAEGAASAIEFAHDVVKTELTGTPEEKRQQRGALRLAYDITVDRAEKQANDVWNSFWGSVKETAGNLFSAETAGNLFSIADPDFEGNVLGARSAQSIFGSWF